MKSTRLILILISLVLTTLALSACSGSGWKKGKDSDVKTVHTEYSRDPILKDISYIDYRWKLTSETDESAMAALEFTVHEGKENYKASANGTITKNVLPSGKSLWEGPLNGTILIDGTEEPIICSFVKLSSGDSVQIAVTFSSGNTSLPITLDFGEQVITEEIYQEIQKMMGK